MEITHADFRNLQFDSLLQECTFISVDGEFTGLRSGKANALNLFDTAEDRFRKHSAGSDGMFLAQVGISLFKHLYLNEYEVSTFNFLISPKVPHFCVRDRHFSFQASSLSLLFRSGFSFDKCFKEGITYISLSEEKECKKSLEQRASKRNQKPENSQNNDDVGRASNNKNPWWQTFEDNICKKLDETLLNGTGPLVLSDFTEEERSVLLRVIEKKYNDKFVLLSNTVKSLKDSEDWLSLHLEDLENCLGFTSVVKKLSASGKPIVGHNIYLDLIHLYRQFVGPLPSAYEEAKICLHETFSCILDTKLLANMEPVKDCVTSSALPELYKIVQKGPFHPPKIKNAAFGPNSEDHLHQAGYDSYITGVVFITLADKLCQLKEEKAANPVEAVCLHSYFNKIFMFRSWDYNYISLDRADTLPNRQNVFHVAFPSAYRTQDLLDLFKSFGRVQIGWIDDTSAYVGLVDADQAPFVMKRLCSSTASLPENVLVKPWNSISQCFKRKSSKADSRNGSEDNESTCGASSKKQRTGSTEKNKSNDDQQMFDVPGDW